MPPLEFTSRNWTFEPLAEKLGAQPRTPERASSGVSWASDHLLEALDAGRLRPERRRYEFQPCRRTLTSIVWTNLRQEGS